MALHGQTLNSFSDSPLTNLIPGLQTRQEPAVPVSRFKTDGNSALAVTAPWL